MWFECKCGNHINDISDHQYFKGHIIPDKKWFPFWDAIDDSIEKSGASPKDKEIACMKLRESWSDTIPIYQCPECARIYIAGEGNSLIAFSPENDDTPKMILDR